MYRWKFADVEPEIILRFGTRDILWGFCDWWSATGTMMNDSMMDFDNNPADFANFTTAAKKRSTTSRLRAWAPPYSQNKTTKGEEHPWLDFFSAHSAALNIWALKIAEYNRWLWITFRSMQLLQKDLTFLCSEPLVYLLAHQLQTLRCSLGLLERPSYKVWLCKFTPALPEIKSKRFARPPTPKLSSRFNGPIIPFSCCTDRLSDQSGTKRTSKVVTLNGYLKENV